LGGAPAYFPGNAVGRYRGDMGSANRESTTSLLAGGAGNDRAATIDRLFPFVYDELGAMARRQLAREHRNATLDTGALVHEAYLRLVDQTRVASNGRAYFFAAAAQAMRRVLVDAARRRGSAKRGGGARPVTLEDGQVVVDEFAAELIDLDRALETLSEEYPRLAEVVECRFFGGLSTSETAEALGVSERTVKYDWAMARAWLDRALRPGSHGEEEPAT